MQRSKSSAIAVLHEGPPRTVTRIGLAMSLMLITLLWAIPVVAQDVTKTHGYSFFGDLKYDADFKQLDYVNPNAPKGGEISQWSRGTFDSFNLYTRKGRAGALAAIASEDILTTVADDINASYCLLCTTMEYPESLDWVIFNLRPEARFSDGSLLTANDIKFSFDLLMEQGLPSFRAAFGSMISAVDVIDDYTIKFSFEPDAPRRDVISLAGGMPAFSQKWYEESGARLDESRLDPGIGSGPYKLQSYKINQRIVYSRVRDYWGRDLPINVGRYNFDTIRIEYFGDGAAAMEGFKAGEYTFRSENSSKQWATAYDFPNLRDGHIIKTELANGNMAPGQSFVFNLRLEKFQDIRVRKAISMMFNFEWSNESLFFDLYARINSFWENSNLAAVGAPTDGEIALLQPLVDQGLLDASIISDAAVLGPASSSRQLDRSNMRLASALLDEAGWLVGDDGLRRKEGKIFEIEFLESSPAFDRIINPYVENLVALGIVAKLNRVDPAQETARIRSYDFDMTTHSMPMSFEPGTGLLQYFGTEAMEESTRNLMGLSDPAVDSLIETVIRADSSESLQTAVKTLDRVLRAKRFWVPQWFKDVHTVAYYDIFEHPETLPPFARGELDFWWFNPEKAAALKSAGVLR
ncbi:MAG: extracellular solute-binding protein [Paracoccaceae bacterium]